MEQTLEARFPASAEVVARMLADRQFYCDRLEQQGHGEYEVLSCNEDPNDFSIRFRRKIPMAAPGAMKNMMAAETSIEHEDFWSVDARKGRVVVKLQGMPLELSCATELRDEGGECVLLYHWNIKSKIPVVGKTIEKAVAAENEKAIPEQTRAGIALLDNYR